MTFMELTPETAFFLDPSEVGEAIEYNNETDIAMELTPQTAFYLGHREATGLSGNDFVLDYMDEPVLTPWCL